MPDAAAPPRSIGPNYRKQAETIARNGQILANVRQDADALALTAARGYNAAKITQGLALAQAFLAEYTERDDATGDRTDARRALAAADKDARNAMSGLRSTLRALYADQPGDLERLGVTRSRMAGDRDTFLTESRATLAAVALDPYPADVAEAGYPAAALTAVSTAVEALATAAGSQTSAGGHLIGATAARNAAYIAFMAWMKRARRFFGLAFRARPDIAARVGL